MSLYTIQAELRELFAHIEDNDGEISDEMFAKLQITRENLNDKLGNYVKAMRTWEGEAGLAKEEAKRFTANAKVKENRVIKLKAAMLDAVLAFGEKGKTNTFIELPTMRLFTKATPAVITDDLRIMILVTGFHTFVTELVQSGVLYTGMDVDLQGILGSINANLKAEHEAGNQEIFGLELAKEFIPYTLKDLTTLVVEISTKQTLYELFREGKDALNLLVTCPIQTRMNNVTPKDDWKGAIVSTEMVNEGREEGAILISPPTVARVVKNQSIQIK